MLRRVREPLLVVLLLAFMTTSCDRATDAVAPSAVAPQATSAEKAARVLEWAVGHSRPDLLEGLLSADFELLAAPADSSGNLWSAGVPRDTVLAAFRALLEGVPGKSAPAIATLGLDRNLIEFPDTRPGRDPRVHRSLRSSCEFRVQDTTTLATIQATGYLLFYMSRADSCALPAGSPPTADTSRWWITRIEDETLATQAPPGLPGRSLTLWQLLEMFLARSRY